MTKEGIIRILRDIVDPQLLRSRRRYLIGSVNDFRRNPLLRKIAAAKFEQELLIPQVAEDAMVRAALVGTAAAGIYRDFEQARELIRYQGEDHGL